MSWIIEYLLKNQEMIRCNINKDSGNLLITPIVEYNLEGDALLSEATIDYNFEDETYTNLLIIEKDIEELKAKGSISEEEYRIIELIKTNVPIIEIEKIIGIEKQTIYKIFSNVCERISYILGGEFTNEGYISKIAREKKLTEEKTQKIRNYFSRNTVSKQI
jgi:hypothetical protein